MYQMKSIATAHQAAAESWRFEMRTHDKPAVCAMRLAAAALGLAVSALQLAGCASTESLERTEEMPAPAGGDAQELSENESDLPAPPSSTLLCSGALQDCDGDATNGCETDIFLDSQHCGGCNQPCTHACIDGRCSAPVQLSAGYSGTCAVLGTGEVRCWGLNYRGELGNGEGGTDTDPVPAIATLAAAPPDRDSSGWNGVPKWSAQPVPVRTTSGAPLRNVQHVARGRYHGCVLTHAGHVYCWGANQYGQLGMGSAGASQALAHQVVAPSTAGAPLQAGFLEGAVELAVGPYISCARLAEGTVACWGRDAFGGLGLGDTNPGNRSMTRPTWVQGQSGGSLQGATHISVGHSSVCIAAAQSVRCAGRALHGGLGDGSVLDEFSQSFPVNVLGPDGISPWSVTPSALVHRSGGPCLLDQAGEAFCWGDASGGQVIGAQGRDNPFPISVQRNLPSATAGSFNQISASGQHVCVRNKEGGVLCWGSNVNHQLGRARTRSEVTLPGRRLLPPAPPIDPVSGNPLEGIIDISAGDTHTCALTEDHRVLCWGSNLWGELGRVEPSAGGVSRAGELPGEVPWPDAAAH